MKNIDFYIDMDGVLADFNNEVNALERFKQEKGFFKSLKPIVENVVAVQMLINRGANVYILSASPNLGADNDKRTWLRKYLKGLKSDNIIIIRNGEIKNNYIKNSNSVNILFDDWKGNIQLWSGIGCKVDSENTIKKWLRDMF